jgi:hypothetical protein
VAFDTQAMVLMLADVSAVLLFGFVVHPVCNAHVLSDHAEAGGLRGQSRELSAAEDAGSNT